MINASFAVRNIFETQGEFSRVSVDNATFNKIRGMQPELPYTTSRDATGNGVRIFNIDGVQVMTRFDKDARKTSFIMKKTDAVRNLRTLEQERAGEPTLAFSF